MQTTSKHTPVTAVALALADFNAANRNCDSDYTDNLREAERLLSDPITAAAPALLEALRDIVNNAPGERHPDWLARGRAAIAKAEGQS